MFTSNFWKQTTERAIKTFVQAALALLGGDGLGVLDVAWPNVASVGALAALISVLTSVATAGVGEPDDPSAIRR